MTEKTDRRESLRKQILDLVGEYAQIQYEPQSFEPGLTPIPPSGKQLGSEELQGMVEASLDGWLTTGRFNDAFERQLAKFIGVRSAITVNSGSSANLVAFMTLTSPMLGERAIQPGEVLKILNALP